MNEFDQLIFLLAPLPAPSNSGWAVAIEVMQACKYALTLIGISFVGAMAGTIKKIYKHGPMGIGRGFMYFFISLVVGCGSSIIGIWLLERTLTAVAGIPVKIPEEVGYGASLICGYGGFELSNYWDKESKNPERLFEKAKRANNNTDQNTPS